MKPFVPLVPGSAPSAWRRLSSGPSHAHGAEADNVHALEAPSHAIDDEASEDAPVLDPELLAELEELRAREAVRTEEHAAAVEELAAQDRAREAQVAELLARLDRVARDVAAARDGLVAEVREGVGAVILEAARRIAGDQLHVDPRLLDAIVDQAVGALGREGLVIRLSPIDAGVVRERLRSTGISVVEDPSLAAGAICEGPSGRIDASLESAAAAIASVLEQWRVAP
jgi:flagellar biosynthesis/type III secretory pathway protein FliH